MLAGCSANPSGNSGSMALTTGAVGTDQGAARRATAHSTAIGCYGGPILADGETGSVNAGFSGFLLAEGQRAAGQANGTEQANDPWSLGTLLIDARVEERQIFTYIKALREAASLQGMAPEALIERQNAAERACFAQVLTAVTGLAADRAGSTDASAIEAQAKLRLIAETLRKSDRELAALYPSLARYAKIVEPQALRQAIGYDHVATAITLVDNIALRRAFMRAGGQMAEALDQAPLPAPQIAQ